jgi:mannose-6-phosphate isomerase
MVEAYPLIFEPILMPKPWGGDRLGVLGKKVARGIGARVGESWELADLSSTSASGAGGGAVASVVRDGPLAGKTLRDAVALWGEKLIGKVSPARDGGFPLLIKYLDARENLSVQVHPSPAFARANPGAHLKTECWLVLAAEPGAMIFKGVREGVTRERFEQALRVGHGGEGGGESAVNLLESVPAIVGECHNLPSGTVHALGAGVLVAEVQTPSDTTFRVYDWGRIDNGVPRQLHIRESLECIQWERARDATSLRPGQARATLVTTGYFDVEHLRGPAGAAKTGDSYRDAMLRPGASTRFALLNAGIADRPVVVMALAGVPRLRWGGGELDLRLGETALMPACLANKGSVELMDAGEVLLATPR